MDLLKRARVLPELDQPHGGNISALRAQLGLEKTEFCDFSVNINPAGPPPTVLDYLRHDHSGVTRYPDPDAAALVDAAAVRHRIDGDCIIAGSGAAELLYWLCAYIKPERTVIVEPSFGDYSSAASANGSELMPVALTRDSGFSIDWRRLERAAIGADLCILGHPNNPTGCLLDIAELIAFVDERPDMLTVVDEAFVDFAADEGGSVVGLAAERSNMVSLRLGYLVGHPGRMHDWRQARAPWPLSELQIEAGRLALGEMGFLEESREKIAQLKQSLCAELAEISWIEPLASDTNFILIEILSEDINDLDVLVGLARQGIIIRACRSFAGLSDRFFRVAVLDETRNQQLIAALRQVTTT
jgi:histidinol-phosphate/aromatic aminotransferase/cobyric acid decarboxylase-like protein